MSNSTFPSLKSLTSNITSIKSMLSEQFDKDVIEHVLDEVLPKSLNVKTQPFATPLFSLFKFNLDLPISIDDLKALETQIGLISEDKSVSLLSPTTLSVSNFNSFNYLSPIPSFEYKSVVPTVSVRDKLIHKKKWLTYKQSIGVYPIKNLIFKCGFKR